jgi:hypothetical protein
LRKNEKKEKKMTRQPDADYMLPLHCLRAQGRGFLTTPVKMSEAPQRSITLFNIFLTFCP